MWKGTGWRRENILRRRPVLIGEFVAQIFKCSVYNFPKSGCNAFFHKTEDPMGGLVCEALGTKNKQKRLGRRRPRVLGPPEPLPLRSVRPSEGASPAVRLHRFGTRKMRHVNSAGSCAASMP